MPEKLKLPLTERPQPFFHRSTLHLTDVTVQGYSFSFRTDFLFDTGSPVSMIAESDLKTKATLWLGNHRAWQRSAIGGTPISMKDLGKCALRIKDAETGNEVVLEQKFYVAAKRGLREGVLMLPGASSESLPNILGMDFFESHNLGITPRDESGIRYLFRA